MDWKEEDFLGFNLKWDYDNGHVTLSMNNYVKNALIKLQHQLKKFPQYSPHEYHSVKWTTKGTQQFAQQEDTSDLLSLKETKYIQSVVSIMQG